MVHCDAGIIHLRLSTDNQHLACILRSGETDAPAGQKALMAQTTRLQEIFMGEFRRGISDNLLQQNILARARRVGITAPRICSHSKGLYLHEPGPFIGLSGEREKPLPRGEVPMDQNCAFAMEVSTNGTVSERNGQVVRCPMEEPVVFAEMMLLAPGGSADRVLPPWRAFPCSVRPLPSQ